MLFGAMVAAIAYLGARPGDTFSGAARAVDGDSLELGGHRVRLYGIDAPERRQTCKKGRRNDAMRPPGTCGIDKDHIRKND